MQAAISKLIVWLRNHPCIYFTQHGLAGEVSFTQCCSLVKMVKMKQFVHFCFSQRNHKIYIFSLWSVDNKVLHNSSGLNIEECLVTKCSMQELVSKTLYRHNLQGLGLNMGHISSLYRICMPFEPGIPKSSARSQSFNYRRIFVLFWWHALYLHALMHWKVAFPFLCWQ